MVAPESIRLVRSGIPELSPMARSGDPSAHTSAVIRDLCIRLGHFAEDPVEGERDYTLMELGSAFEEAVVFFLARRYAAADPARFCQPGELEKEGLIGTPDLLDVLAWAIHEIKLTKLSSNQPLDGPKFWKYWMQLGTYCYMAETTLGYLHVCHLNGNYKENRSPDYRVYEVHWTMDELRRIWRQMKTHAALLRKAAKR